MDTRGLLLHIGYHKTGTTWLQQYLFSSRAHGFISPLSTAEMMDRIVLPHPLDFSASECREGIERRLGEITSDGLTPVLSNERFSGHPHSGGYDSKVLADRLKEMFPTARVFMCIREQEQAILSSYNQYIRTGGAISIASYLNVAERSRVPLFDFRHFMYHRLIGYYQSIFGKQNVLVLPFRLFTQDTSRYVSSIIEFATGRPARVDLSSLPASDRSNRSITGFDLVILKMVNYIIGTRNSINQFSLLPMSRERTRSLFRLVQKVDPLFPGFANRAIVADLRKTVSDMVGERYRESNRITSGLIGMDLAQYGFQV